MIFKITITNHPFNESKFHKVNVEKRRQRYTNEF